MFQNAYGRILFSFFKLSHNDAGHGCDRYDFKVLGKNAIIVFPKKFTPKNKWVWRAEFFDAFPIVDLDLLEQGWALTYIGAATVSYLFMRLLDKLDRPGK